MKNKLNTPEDQKNYFGQEMTIDEAITWVSFALFVGLSVCALLSGIAAKVADKCIGQI